MLLRGVEGEEGEKWLSRPVVFSLQGNSVNNLNFWVKLASPEHVMSSRCGHRTV